MRLALAILMIAGVSAVAQTPAPPTQRIEEEVTIYATRTDRRLQDSPTRVEVLNREEIEEKMLMTPGDIVMMLNEMGGLRVQTTSPGLGAASVRIQGMRGRYTRFLSDGLPLFGQQGAGLGLLQIPPTDLGQVEVIKGMASSLYGSAAMAGVVNLVSRRPGKEPVRELLVNRSALGATDGTFFFASPLGSEWGASLLAGAHGQQANDIDGDGWADLAGYARGVIRPRFFWQDAEGRSALLTGGITLEDRNGGTISGAVLPSAGIPYREALNSRRYDVGGVLTLPLGRVVLTNRLAASWQHHDHRFGEVRERDRHDLLFAETALRGVAGKHTWVAGAAVDVDTYRPRDVPRFAYRYTTPGIFLQDEFDATPWLSISAGARADFHNVYGTFFSPRVSALLRFEAWTSRISAGQGFFAPTPLTEDTESAGLSRLAIPVPLRAERGRSVSVDLTRNFGAASATVTLFASRVRNPISVVYGGADPYRLVNLPEPTTNQGVEFLGTWRKDEYSFTANYMYVRSRELDNGRRVAVPLTPAHSFGIVGMWERENTGRIGIECYYTGHQRLERNPFRAQSPAYVSLGVLIERRVGIFRLFLNAENLTDARQTRWDPCFARIGLRTGAGRWMHGRLWTAGSSTGVCDTCSDAHRAFRSLGGPGGGAGRPGRSAKGPELDHRARAVAGEGQDGPDRHLFRG